MSDDDPASMPNDIKVSTWTELLDVLHSLDLIPHQREAGDHRRSPFLFRGMSNAEWPLTTSLERLGSPVHQVEGPLLRAFERYTPAGTESLGSEWKRLAVAQHNGLPTRVMDWTGSPLIAVHFATVEAAYRNGDEATDGIIWAVNASVVRYEILPSRMRSALDDAQAFVYSVPLLDQLYPSLRHFDDDVSKDADEVMIFFEPPSIDARIQNQYGLLSMMNGADKSHEHHLRAQAALHPDLVRRVLIDRDAKSEIRDMLDQNNITERMLFPGLPGLCDWLRRYYGPA
ncbi:MAG: FRG domain-containing protein [Acidobacteriota bacterium]